MTEVLNSILVLLGACGWPVKLGPLPLTIIQEPGMGPRCPPVTGVPQVALMQVDQVVAGTLRNSKSHPGAEAWTPGPEALGSLPLLLQK